jgi:hypothetical protein
MRTTPAAQTMLNTSHKMTYAEISEAAYRVRDK